MRRNGWSDILNGESAASFSMWFNPSRAQVSSAGLLVSRGTSFQGVILQGDHGVRILINTTQLLTVSSVLTVGTRMHIVFTWDGTSGDTRLYLDGTLNSEVPAALTGTIAVDAAWYIGKDTFGTRRIRGYMGDVRVYNKVLSESEVLSIFAYPHDLWTHPVSRPATAAGPAGPYYGLAQALPTKSFASPESGIGSF